MLKRFSMNGNLWAVETVPQSSPFLIDRTLEYRVATTDPDLHKIFLLEDLYGSFKKRVLIHEMTHVVLWEYGIIDRIAVYCYPEYCIAMEEEICNVLADYGEMVFNTAYKVLGDEAIRIVPYQIERLVA